MLCLKFHQYSTLIEEFDFSGVKEGGKGGKEVWGREERYPYLKNSEKPLTE